MLIVALGLKAIISTGTIYDNLCTAESYHWAALHSHITNKISIKLNVFKSVVEKKSEM